MPKQTFFNLPESKRNLIICAAKEEFSRAMLEEASIANIIKTAQIPRGSFYQYFEDKDDLFKYILEEGYKIAMQQFFAFLDEEQGDLVAACEKLFYFNIENLEKEENRSLGRNIFLSMNEKLKESVLPHVQHPSFHTSLNEMYSKIDRSLLGLDEPEEFHYLMRMIKSVLFQGTTQYLVGRITKEECFKNHRFQMKVIRKAVYKKDI